MNTLIEFSRAIRILKSRYPIYLLILIIGFLLQRSVLIDIPMNNDEGRLPLKKDASGEQIYQTINGRITNKNISINIQYGTSNRPDLYCISNGNNIFVGG